MKPPCVLFVCEDNALLSPLAEAYLNAVARGRVRAFSAGPRPAGRVDPMVGELLGEKAIAVEAFSPKSWELFALPHAPEPEILVVLGAAVGRYRPPDWLCAPRVATWPAPTGPFTPTRARDAFRRIRMAIDRALPEAPESSEAPGLLRSA